MGTISRNKYVDIFATYLGGQGRVAHTYLGGAGRGRGGASARRRARAGVLTSPGRTGRVPNFPTRPGALPALSRSSTGIECLTRHHIQVCRPSSHTNRRRRPRTSRRSWPCATPTTTTRQRLWAKRARMPNIRTRLRLPLALSCPSACLGRPKTHHMKWFRPWSQIHVPSGLGAPLGWQE